MHSSSAAVQEGTKALQERRRAVQENVLENSRMENSLKAVQAVYVGTKWGTQIARVTR